MGALLLRSVSDARLSTAQIERRYDKTTSEARMINFIKWRSNNSDLHNWQQCPSCNGSGNDIETDDLCSSCNGRGRVDDLYSLYIADVERDQIAIQEATGSATTNAGALVE